MQMFKVIGVIMQKGVPLLRAYFIEIWQVTTVFAHTCAAMIDK